MNYIKSIIHRFNLYKILHPIYLAYSYLYYLLYKSFINRNIIIRKKTSDLEVFGQIFVLKEYKFNIGFIPKFMIDAGANVGYVTVYFKSRFPDLKIIAIEPEKSNYDILVQNTRNLKDVKCLQEGLWHKISKLTIETVGHDKWGFIVRDAKQDEKDFVNATTINELLKSSKFDYIDILKIDIEGSEKEVFENARDWINKVNVIFIETHDRFKPGSEASVYSAIPENMFSEHKDGENVIFLRKIILK